MTPEQQVIEAQILHAHVAKYWYEVDLNGGVGVSMAYTEDGVFRGSAKPLVGRAAIQHFYDWRLEKGARTSRHLVTNFHAEFQDDANATSYCIMTLFAADGTPVRPSTPPLLISDQIDRWVKGADGTWLVADRNFVAIFVDSVGVKNSAMAKADDSPFKA